MLGTRGVDPCSPASDRDAGMAAPLARNITKKRQLEDSLAATQPLQDRARSEPVWQIVLQKSPRRSCRIKIRNNRIGANGFLNQRCALTPDLESILRTQTGKILLQQNRHFASFRSAAAIQSPSERSGHSASRVCRAGFMSTCPNSPGHW